MTQYEALVKEKYEKHILDDVIIHKDGFEIKHGAWSFWIPHEKNIYEITPKIGDVAFFYGDGVGRPVLGIQLNDKVVFFRSRDEEEQRRQKMIESWKEKNKKEYEVLMEKIKDEEPFETVDVSGFGSGYERACQLMIQAGIKFLKDNEFHFDYYTYKGVYGICTSDAPWSKKLDDALMEAAGGDCTGAMHQCVIGHLQYIHKNGYDQWLKTAKDERKYTYPKELPPPS